MLKAAVVAMRPKAPLRCPCGRGGYLIHQNWATRSIVFAHGATLHAWEESDRPGRRLWTMHRVAPGYAS